MASEVTVEDGSSKSDADSYASESDADTYFDDRNESDWSSLGQDKKSAALRKATSFLDSHFDWKGEVADEGQALDWPRDDVTNDEDIDIPDDVVPEPVKTACMELAYFEAVIGELAPYQKSGETKRIAAGSVEVEYADNDEPKQSISRVTNILDGLTIGGQNTARLTRV